MKELIGKIVSGLRINDDQTILVFDYPVKTYTAYKAVGDSWTSTWFSEITGVSALLGAIVLDSEIMETEQTEIDGQTSYGIKLKTNKGYVDIVYRNDCNLYGGYIYLLKDTVTEKMVDICDDWEA